MTEQTGAAGLLPCPFCGGNAHLYQQQNATALFYVRCVNCDAGPHSDLGREAAVARWNKRARPQAGVEREALARLLLTHPDGGNVTPGSTLITPEAIAEWLQLADAILALPAKGGDWRAIETAPKDVEVLLGWWSLANCHEPRWTMKVGLAACTKGGWLDGHATHWQPLPASPEPALPQDM